MMLEKMTSKWFTASTKNNTDRHMMLIKMKTKWFTGSKQNNRDDRHTSLSSHQPSGSQMIRNAPARAAMELDRASSGVEKSSPQEEDRNRRWHSAPISNGILRNGKGSPNIQRPRNSSGIRRVTFSLRVRVTGSQMSLNDIAAAMDFEAERARSDCGTPGPQKEGTRNGGEEFREQECNRRTKVTIKRDITVVTDDDSDSSEEQTKVQITPIQLGLINEKLEAKLQRQRIAREKMENLISTAL